MDKTKFIDFNAEDIHKNTREIVWLDEDEFKIGDDCFDVLQTEKQANGKIRVYVFCDSKEKTIDLAAGNSVKLKTNSGKKGKRNILAEILKLKTYTQQFFFQVCQNPDERNYIACHLNTHDGYDSVIDHPPASI